MSILDSIKADFDGKIPRGLNFGYKNGIKIGDKFVSITVSSKFKKYGGFYSTKYICTLFENALVLGVYTKFNGVKKYQPMFTFSKSKHGKILCRKAGTKFILNGEFFKHDYLGVIPKHFNLCKVFKYYFSKHKLDLKIFNKQDRFSEFLALNYSPTLRLINSLVPRNTLHNFINPDHLKDLDKITSEEDLQSVLNVPQNEWKNFLASAAESQKTIELVVFRYLFRNIDYNYFIQELSKSKHYCLSGLFSDFLNLKKRLKLSNQDELNFKALISRGFYFFNFDKKFKNTALGLDLLTARKVITVIDQKEYYIKKKFNFLSKKDFNNLLSKFSNLYSNFHVI